MISKLELVFQEWAASLQGRDRSKAAIESNFDELFTKLKQNGGTLESVYEYLAKASKAHQPSAQVIKNTYKKIKQSGKMTLSEKEFADSWIKNINDTANTCFFVVFPVETPEEIVEPEDPAVYGSMSEKEYRAQRKHAGEYPRLNTAQLEEKMLSGSYDPMVDLPTLLGKI
jgi:hypothetical protein